MGKVYFEVYGCQMNVADANSLRQLLKERGHIEVEKPEEADMIILETCSVRGSAEERIHGRLGALSVYKKKYPTKKIVVMGCMAQLWGEKLKNLHPYIDAVVGTYNLTKVIEILEKSEISDSGIYTSMEKYQFLKYAKDVDFPFRAFVNVIHGCNHRCTYCVVPFTRGKEVSRPIHEIVEDIKRLVDEEGIREVVLLGQNVNNYGKDIGTDFGELLYNVSKISNLPRISFITSHPMHFDLKYIDIVADTENIIKYFHIPIQSGSNRILRLMGRGYTVEMYGKIIEYIRKKVPDAMISTDIMVGFPTETEEDFKETLKAVEMFEFDYAYMFIYNDRPGTFAEKMEKKIPYEEKVRRLQELIKLQHKHIKKSNEKEIGKEHKVLLEKKGKKGTQLIGKTHNYKNVVVEGLTEDFIGKITKVKITGVTGNSLIGEIIV